MIAPTLSSQSEPLAPLSLLSLLKASHRRLIVSASPDLRQNAALGKLFFGFDPAQVDEWAPLLGKIAYLFINRAILLRLFEENGLTHDLPRHPKERLHALSEPARFLLPELAPLFSPTLEYGKFFGEVELLDLLTLLQEHPFSGWPFRFLGDLFENLLDPEERSGLGQFYTPQRIVDFILDETLEPLFASRLEALAKGDPLPSLVSLRLLDPTCGCGHFLQEAYARFFRQYEREGEKNPADIHRKILRHNLWGSDLNPLAIQLAKTSLFLLGVEHGAYEVPNLLNTDALFLHEGRSSGKGIAPKIEAVQELTFSFAMHSRAEAHDFFQPFDLVVGNPPYGASLSRIDRTYYGHNYESAKGRFDTVGLFVERGLKLLKPGGKLGFVIPHAFSRTGAYLPARQLVVRDGRVLFLANVLSAFEGVNLNTMILGVEKSKEEGNTRLWDGVGPAFKLIGEVPSAFFASRKVFPIYLSPTSLGILTRMEEKAIRLSDLAHVHRGEPISNRDPALLAWREGLTPVIRGRDIRAYRKLDKTPLGIEGKAGLTQSVVGFQNIASRFQATLFPEGTLPLDTTNYLQLEDPSLTRWLIALLNSRAIHYYLTEFLLNRATLTVHLDAPTIGDLPIVLPDPETLSKVDRLVDEALEGKLSEELEGLVSRAYGLDPEMIVSIDSL